MAEHQAESTEEVKEKVEKEFKWYGKEYLAFILTIVLGIVVGAVALNYFLGITDDLQREQLGNFDDKVTSFIYEYRSDTMTSFVSFLTDLGDVQAYVILIVAVAIWFLVDKKSIRWLIQSIIILSSTALLNIVIKQYISRPRPDLEMRLVEAHSFSYPSGHSMCALAFYGFLLYLAHKKVDHTWVKILAYMVLPLLIVAIGASRVYLGVHYPSDVVAGFAAGLFWLIFVIFLMNIFRYYRQKRKEKEYVLALEDREDD